MFTVLPEIILQEMNTIRDPSQPGIQRASYRNGTDPWEPGPEVNYKSRGHA